MLLHEFGHYFVLLDQLLLQGRNLAILTVVGTFTGLLKRLLGMVEHLLDPAVNLGGLYVQLIRQIGNRLFAQ